MGFFAVARTDCLPENLIDSAKRGRVSVNANSQSTVQKNVFAVGCGNRWMVGIDATIKKEAAAVAQNVQDVLDGKAPSISLPEECPATVDYVHIGLGEYTMMNMDQKGCFPTVISNVWLLLSSLSVLRMLRLVLQLPWKRMFREMYGKNVTFRWQYAPSACIKTSVNVGDGTLNYFKKKKRWQSVHVQQLINRTQ